MNSDPRLSDLLLRWEELCEQGQPTAVEELCRDCPHLLDELCRQVHALQAMNPLLRTAAAGPHEKGTPFPGATPVAARPEGDLSSPLWPAIPGYEIEHELGRGGMGIVYLARQLQLNRRVALKMILPESCGSAQQRQRFRAEAEIVAGLQHPHIVQIFDVGEVDGRAFCALELIEGGNLAEALAGQPCPPRVAAQLLATLADAVQAAHEKGVLHRDLKPANVLLASACGLAENYSDLPAKPQAARQALDGVIPKLTDFGLAKQLAADQGLTQTGMVMGTPSYIAPEQVQGRNRELGPPADVYSLGAILYEALTGRPPLLGPTVLETFQLVLSHDPLPVRSLQPAVPHDLDTICLKCLHKDPGRRYGTARELGDDLRCFLAGEPVRARPTPSWERAIKWARRRPATAALLLLMVLAVGGAAYALRQHELRGWEQVQRRREAETAAETTLKKVGELQQQQRWAESRVLLEQATRQQSEDVPQELRIALEQALADVVLVGELEEIRLKIREIVKSKINYASADSEYAAVFENHHLGRPGDDAAAVAVRVSVSAVKEQLVAALDDWAIATKDTNRQAWLLEVARRADPDPWRDRMRDPAVRRDSRKLEEVVAQAKVEELSPQVAWTLSYSLKAEPAIRLLRAVQRRHPNDFLVNFCLGTRLNQDKQSDDAISYLRAAVALRPREPAALSNLSIALSARGEVDEAIHCLRQVLELNSGLPTIQNHLGKLLCDTKHDYDGAIACFRKVIALEPRNADGYYNLGNALGRKGKLDEAIASFRKAIDIDPEYASVYHNLGLTLYLKGKLDEAIACLRKAIELKPRDVDALTNLGLTLDRAGRGGEAITAWREAVRLEPRLGIAHYWLGRGLLRDGLAGQAVAHLRQAEQLLLAPQRREGQVGMYLRQAQRQARGEELLAKRAVPGSSQDWLDLAAEAGRRGRHATAAEAFRTAFAADARLASNLGQSHRYNAACSAALAGCGKGKDPGSLTEVDRLALRLRALTWLRADLAAWQRQLKSWWPGQADQARAALRHWQTDADLAGLRDGVALANLGAEERSACQRLWTDVAALLRKPTK